MKKEKILYAVTSKDVMSVSNEVNITVSSKDIPFIEDRIGDFFGSQWYDAVEFALMELDRLKRNKRIT